MPLQRVPADTNRCASNWVRPLGPSTEHLPCHLRTCPEAFAAEPKRRSARNPHEARTNRWPIGPAPTRGVWPQCLVTAGRVCSLSKRGPARRLLAGFDEPDLRPDHYCWRTLWW